MPEPTATTLGLSLLRMIQDFKKVPIDYLASRLKKSPEDIDRELKSLEDKKIVSIDHDDRTVSITRP
jgi:hypothetical protein